jgi:hypothetical protein
MQKQIDQSKFDDRISDDTDFKGYDGRIKVTNMQDLAEKDKGWTVLIRCPDEYN